jgi:hypothetical protein
MRPSRLLTPAIRPTQEAIVNRDELNRLQAVESFPCLTITMPTHRTHPENKQDPIRLQNLTRQAEEKLIAEVGKREAAPLLRRLEALTAGLDLDHLRDGLALFVNSDYSESFAVPHVLEERVVVDATFYVRDLVRATNRSYRYRVLTLTEKPIRHFEAVRDDLVEITAGKFPMTHERPGGDQRMPGGKGINKSALRDEYLSQFFRDVDAEYRRLTAGDPLPLVLVGIGNYLPIYQGVMRNPEQVLTTVTGSHDVTTAHELSKIVWPAARAAFTERREARLGELNAAMSDGKQISGVQEVWSVVAAGRAATLFVEEGFRYPAKRSDDGMWLTPMSDTTGEDTMDDAVDEIITATLDKGGEVIFVDDGVLEQAGRIALIARY